VRALGRSLLLVAMLLAAMLDACLRRPRQGTEGAVWIHRWCGRFLRVMGVTYEVRGDLPRTGAVVCNHLSYLDILVMSAAAPFVMVSKSEVKSWPLVGWLTARAGTVYVQRSGGPATYPGVNAAMAEAYRSGLPVLFFPEGTTTDGDSGILAFRRGLFHSVLENEVPLWTAAVRYEVEGGGSVANDVCWWGDMFLGPHVWRLLGLRGVRARVKFGEEIVTRRDRFELSEGARAAVAEMYAELGGAVVIGVREAELVEVL
jgi:1-acyl-sn-glycerol-3-phosphate acyltransferase